MNKIMFLLGCLTTSFLAYGQDSLFEAVDGESYLKLEFLPLCSVEGQVIFQVTNTSGQLLLVDSAFVDVETYDAHRSGIRLTHFTEEVDYSDPATRSRGGAYSENDWTPLEVGEVVQHKIDFRDYAVLPVDTSLQYMPIFNGKPIRMITTVEGKKVTLFKSVIDDTFSDQFGSECWK